jgi:hypothetical protein
MVLPSFGKRIKAVLGIILIVFTFVIKSWWLFADKNDNLKDISRIDCRKELVTPEQFKKHVAENIKPLVLEGCVLTNTRIKLEDWTLDALQKRFATVSFRTGAAPYPSLTRLGLSNDVNEPLEVFQFGTLPATFALGIPGGCKPIFARKYFHAAYIHDNAEIACQLLNGVSLPDFVRENAPLVPLGKLPHFRTSLLN